jgi:hypothetical protein
MSRGGTCLDVGDDALQYTARNARQPSSHDLTTADVVRGSAAEGGEQDFAAGKVIVLVFLEKQKRRSGWRSGLRLYASRSTDGNERMDGCTFGVTGRRLFAPCRLCNGASSRSGGRRVELS